MRSVMIVTSTPGGSAFSSRGSADLIRSAVSVTFAPGCRKFASCIPHCPFAQPAMRAFSGPSTAIPTVKTLIDDQPGGLRSGVNALWRVASAADL